MANPNILSRKRLFRIGNVDNDIGLVGRWTFDGGSLVDVSGNQNHLLANHTAPDFSELPVGGAYSFGTSSKYFDINSANSPISQSVNRVTVCAWWVPSVTSRSDLISVWLGNGSTASDQFVLLSGITANTPQFFVSNGSAQGSGNSSIPVVVGQLCHIAGTFDGTNVSVYVNGVLGSATVHAVTMGTGTGNWLQVGTSDGGFNVGSGTMSDVRCYNRALPASELMDIYLRGLTHQITDDWDASIMMVPAAPSSSRYRSVALGVY